MDLDKLLSESLERLEAMHVDEFEAMCIKAGYKPVRKVLFVPANALSVDLSIAYVKATSINVESPKTFNGSSANAQCFSLAA